MLKIAVCLVIAASIAAAQTPPRAEVTGVGNFIHIVSNLDKTLVFYHDILGMDMPRPAAAFTDTPEILRLYDAIGGKYRVGNTQIAGSPMRMELEEWQGVERTPVHPKVNDPGASLLILTVRQLEPVLAKLKAAGIKPVSAGDGPVQIAADTRAITVPDPDGFYIVLEEKAGAPAAGPGESNIVGLRFAFVVTTLSSIERAFGALALNQMGGFNKSDAYQKLLDTKGEIGRLKASLPNVDWPLEFIEIRGGSKKVATARLPHPGAPILRLTVKDANAAVIAFKAAGVSVASAGGEVITLPGGKAQLHAAILSLPNNLFVQVLQQ